MTKSTKTLVTVGAVGIIIWLLTKGNTAFAAIVPGNAQFDLTQLISQYGATNVQALTNLYADLLQAQDPNTGNNLTPLQVRLMLDQALNETGLFTDSPNWAAVGNNNFAGITPNGNYQAASNSRFAAYPDIPTFIQNWIGVLYQNTEPINASSVSDFNTRLNANGYYGSDNSTTYGNNLQAYDNILANVQV